MAGNIKKCLVSTVLFKRSSSKPIVRVRFLRELLERKTAFCNQYEKVKRNRQGMYQETDAPLTTEELPSEAYPALFVIFYLMLFNVTKLNSTNFLPFISSVCSFIYLKRFFELIMLKFMSLQNQLPVLLLFKQYLFNYKIIK